MTEKKIWQVCVAGVAVGMVILFYGIYVWLSAEAQEKWPVVQGKIVSSQVKREQDYSHRGRNSYSHDRSEVNYSYSVSGQSYQGSQHSGSGKLSHRYPTGSIASIHYNPANPSSSIIEPELIIGKSYTWAGFVICVLLPIAATVISKQLTSGTDSKSLVQDPTDKNEVLAWKQRNGMSV